MMMRAVLMLVLVATVASADLYGLMTTVSGTGAPGAAANMTLVHVHSKGDVSALCSVPALADGWVSPGSMSGEIAYMSSEGTLVVVDLSDDLDTTCSVSELPVETPAGVVLVAEPSSGAGDGQFAGVTGGGTNFTAGFIDLSSGEIDSLTAMTVFTPGSEQWLSSAYDTVNDLFVLAVGPEIFLLTSDTINGGFIPKDVASVTGLVFNWRNNGYYGIVQTNATAPLYVAQVNVDTSSTSVSLDKVVVLDGVDSCQPQATYDIPNGVMYVVCSASGTPKLFSVPLDGSAPTSVDLGVPSGQTVIGLSIA